MEAVEALGFAFGGQEGWPLDSISSRLRGKHLACLVSLDEERYWEIFGTS